MKYCEKCGNKMADDSLFCSKCGRKVADAEITDKEEKTDENKAENAGKNRTDVQEEVQSNVRTQYPVPDSDNVPVQKKVVDYLYIDADEDHAHLQFQEKKGDLEVSESGRKKNGVITKLIYVYEGVRPVAPKSKRHCLIGTHYFCRCTEDNKALWDEVYEYIDTHYDLSKVKKVYLNADGGPWIKSGINRLHGVEYVLDEFHLSKYLLKMTRHMKDTQEDAKIELCKAIRSKEKADFIEIRERLMDCTTDEKVLKRIEESAQYILDNWTAAKRRLKHRDAIYGCSAEGHVYHVLSSRMSTLAMGWSRKGVAKMAQLREW